MSDALKPIDVLFVNEPFGARVVWAVPTDRGVTFGSLCLAWGPGRKGWIFWWEALDGDGEVRRTPVASVVGVC